MEGKDESKKKGVITVEATLILPIYILAILFVINFLNVGYMQLTIQQGLNNAGQTFAQYGYVIDMLVGIDTINNKEFESKAGSITKAIEEFTTSAKSVGEVFNNFSLNRISELGEAAKNFVEKAKGVKNAFSGVGGVAKDNLVGFLLTGASEGGSTFIVKAQIEEYLDAMKVNRSLLDGDLVYHVSMAKADSNAGLSDNDIILRVSYRYKPSMFSIFLKDGICMQQVVVVRPWIGGSTEGVRQK